MKILVTGCCGFIGTNLCKKLFRENHIIYGIDCMFDNYDINFKKENLNFLKTFNNFIYTDENILNSKIIENTKPDIIIHLASIPGVRKSIEDPLLYVKNNIEAFVYLLEEAKKYNIRVIYASSSSVYGANEKVPFSEDDDIEKLRSSYACSKKCMEVYAKYYRDVFKMDIIGLRFFTVYGEHGRPDMAPYMFLKNIAEEKYINQFGDGNSYRDYTYIDDIVDGITKLLNSSKKEYIYNLGNNSPITLKEFIKLCEKITEKKAKINYLENQIGDVEKTFADISKAKRDFNFEPKTNIEEGLKLTFKWMIENKRINLK